MRITINNIKDAYKSKLVDIKTMEVKGYKHLVTLFVDSSGFGQEDEPALTASAFERELERLVKEYGAVYTTVVNAGMFQVYVGVFIKTGKATGRKLALHTYRYTDTDGADVIRYHATDILRSKDGKTTIDNGGFYTKTTKERLSEYLPDGYYIKQQNFEWFLYQRSYDYDTGAYKHEFIAPFKQGMTIEGVI